MQVQKEEHSPYNLNTFKPYQFRSSHQYPLKEQAILKILSVVLWFGVQPSAPTNPAVCQAEVWPSCEHRPISQEDQDCKICRVDFCTMTRFLGDGNYRVIKEVKRRYNTLACWRRLRCRSMGIGTNNINHNRIIWSMPL